MFCCISILVIFTNIQLIFYEMIFHGGSGPEEVWQPWSFHNHLQTSQIRFGFRSGQMMTSIQNVYRGRIDQFLCNLQWLQTVDIIENHQLFEWKLDVSCYNSIGYIQIQSLRKCKLCRKYFTNEWPYIYFIPLYFFRTHKLNVFCVILFGNLLESKLFTKSCRRATGQGRMEVSSLPGTCHGDNGGVKYLEAIKHCPQTRVFTVHSPSLQLYGVPLSDNR